MSCSDISRRHVLGLPAIVAALDAAPGPPGEPVEFPLYKARGAHRELGRQHGEQAARQIRAHVDLMCAAQKLSRERLTRKAAQFRPLFERHCSHLLEEMRGMAEGAGIALEDAIACNVRGELRAVRDEGCTAFALAGRAAAAREVIAGQNSDMGAEALPLAYVLHLQPRGKPEVLIWTFGGMLGYHGMNSAGVAHFSNALGGGPRSRYGMPDYPAQRLMLECGSLEQALDVLRRMPLASNENYILCDAKGNIAAVEATTEGLEILLDRGAGYLVHTNHFLSRRYAIPENLNRSLADSFPRLDRFESLVKSRWGSIGLQDIKRFLGDHSGYPVGICRHDRGMQTVASLISEPARRCLHVALGNPCDHRYRT